jgi:membrane protein
MAETVRRTRTHDASGFAYDWSRLREILSRRGARRLLSDLLEGFARNDLLTYASAISFRVLFALVPLLLAGVAVLGFFDLEEVWSDEVAPQIRSRVSTGAFEVIDATVQEILRSGSGFWLTFGVALAVWEVSAAIRALMGSLNLIYGSEERRSTLRRFAVSVVLAVVTAGALGLAIVALQLGPQIADSIGLTHGVALFFARWIGAAVLMTAVVVMLIRFAPARHQRRSLFGVTAVFVTAAWIGASLVFNWYTTTVAAYQSLFGNLSIVIVLMTYLYVSAVTFLVGVQIDAILRGYARRTTPTGRRRAEASRAS